MLVVGGASLDTLHVGGKPTPSAGGAGLYTALHLEKALGKKAKIERRPVPPGDVKQTYADITRAQKELGYKPKTQLQAGLERFVEWLRELNIEY